MKKYMRYITAVFFFSICICGCQCSAKGGQVKAGGDNTQLKEVTVDEELLSPSGIPDEPTDEEIEEFYHSLPQLGLPLTWDDEEFENQYPVPERIANYLGFEYIYDSFDAARLPEVEGARSMIVTIGQTGGFISRYIFVFPAGEMCGADFQAIYNVREIDEGPEMLVNFFRIDEQMEIELTTRYIGTDAKGNDVNILFRHEYLKPASDGRLHTVTDRSRETVTYTEAVDTVFGESFPSYNFTVTTHTPFFDEENGEWDCLDHEKWYSMNDEGRLIEVDLFDSERDYE